MESARGQVIEGMEFARGQVIEGMEFACGHIERLLHKMPD